MRLCRRLQQQFVDGRLRIFTERSVRQWCRLGLGNQLPAGGGWRAERFCAPGCVRLRRLHDQRDVDETQHAATFYGAAQPASRAPMSACPRGGRCGPRQARGRRPADDLRVAVGSRRRAASTSTTQAEKRASGAGARSLGGDDSLSYDTRTMRRRQYSADTQRLTVTSLNHIMWPLILLLLLLIIIIIKHDIVYR